MYIIIVYYTNNTDATIFAGESKFGSVNIGKTLRIIYSGPKTGSHLIHFKILFNIKCLSRDISYKLNLSSLSGCNIEIHTVPSAWTW